VRWLGPTLLAAAAAAFALWGWADASPRWTLAQMQRAAAAGDARRLLSFVDYAELRRSDEADRRARFAHLLSIAPARFRPRLVADLQWRKLRNPREFGIRPDYLLFALHPPPGEDGGRLGIEMPSFDRFRVVDRSNPYPEPGGWLTFRREGLGWRLVAMQTYFEEFPEGPPRNGWFDRALNWLRRRG